jgi:aminomethyltransferase
MSKLKRTPLRDFHAAHGGRLVDFAGWEMPVQYKSILEEHKAVRRTAGLFDVSHMGEVDVRGPGALAYLQHLVTNDVAITDRSEDFGLVAVQGPKAADIVQSLTGAKLGAVKYYHFVEAPVAGFHCIVSRTGYTGEDGFELYVATGETLALTEALLAAGAHHGLELAGLGARDSLRLEAGYPLYGHEITAEISPLTAGLGWTVKLDKGADFIGRSALAAEKQNGSPHKVVFFRTGDRRIVRAETTVLGSDGRVVGRVLSGTLSPILNEAIGSALVETPAAAQPLAVDVRGAKLNLHLVKPPFVELKKTS